MINFSEQPWYEAEDKAVARDIISPRNSSTQGMSIAEIRLPIRLPIRVSIGVEVIPHHHIMEEMYHVISGSGLMMVDDQYQQKVTGDSVVT